MNKKELSQLYYLNREIKAERKKLLELRAAATDTSVHISGLPSRKGISDKTAIATRIVESEETIERKLNQAISEYNRLNKYIEDIKNSQMRMMIAARFRDCKTWKGVAREVGGKNTASGCRSAVERFLRKE